MQVLFIKTMNFSIFSHNFNQQQLATENMQHSTT